MEQREINATLVVSPRYSLPDGKTYTAVPSREAHPALLRSNPTSTSDLMDWMVRYDHFSLVLEETGSGVLVGEKPLTAVMSHIRDPAAYTPREAVLHIVRGTAGFVPARSSDEKVYNGLLGELFAEVAKARESGMSVTPYRQACIKINPVHKRIRVHGTKPDAVLLPEDLLLRTLPEEAMTEPFLLEHLVL